MIKLIIFLLISSIQCNYLFLNSTFSSNIKYDNSSTSFDKTSLTLGYAHKIIDESYFSLYAGLSYTLNPLIYKNNNIYTSDSDNGIIYNCEDIIDPIQTELNIGYIFLNPEYNFTQKITGWFNIGINMLDVNYLQSSHPYELWDWECTQFCSADNPDDHIYDWVLKDVCDSCPDEFLNVNAFGGMAFAFGLDYKISDKIKISLSRHSNSSKNIDGYDISVFNYSDFDLKSTSWFLGMKYDI